MDIIAGINWEKMLLPETPLLEIFARGSLIYVGLFLLLRLVLKRQAGTIGMTDLLVITLIADAAQNGMSASYQSVADGILLVITIIFWSALLDWLGYSFPHTIGRIIYPPPLKLIENGRLNHRNMRAEFLTKEELLSQLREQGVEDIAQVKRACMEGDGHISVVKIKGE